MRAILLLLMVAAGCGGKAINQFELDITVDAPGAAAVLIDGSVQIPPVGGVYSRGYPNVDDAAAVTGMVQTLDAMGGVRATSGYAFDGYCAAVTPLLKQNEKFVETMDAGGAVVLVLDSVECIRTDGTGMIIHP
jgi:hypothetical protein